MLAAGCEPVLLDSVAWLFMSLSVVVVVVVVEEVLPLVPAFDPICGGLFWAICVLLELWSLLDGMFEELPLEAVLPELFMSDVPELEVAGVSLVTGGVVPADWEADGACDSLMP